LINRVSVAASRLTYCSAASGEPPTVSPVMSVFRVSDDGRLQFVRRYDVERGERTQYWVGMVGLP
jgi:hypothetical protein